jgi:hypothetical protein
MIRNLSFESNVLKMEIDLTAHFSEVNETEPEPITVGGVSVTVRALPTIPGENFMEVVVGLAAPEVE